MTSFAEFLKKESFQAWESSGMIPTIKAIPVRALGEYFLKESKDWLEYSATELDYKGTLANFKEFILHAKNNSDETGANFFLNAIACLGESEIKKRLEELK